MIKLILDKYLGGVVRHMLTFLAGILVAYGLSEGQTAQFVAVNTEVIVGVLSYVIGQGLSFVNTKKNS